MIRSIGKLIFSVGVVWLLFSIMLILPWRWVNPPMTSFILQDWWENDRFPQQQWVPLNHISRQLQIAVVASEDQLFPVHYGFDLKMIADAIEEAPNRRRGASTISQQVAKNLYLWSGRSYIRKVLEAWLTLLIEALWSKERILEVYLNIAEFGRGIYGASMASQQLFNKPANQLTRYEAALLTAVLPNPKWRRANRPSSYVKRRAGEIMQAIKELGEYAI